MRRLVLGVVALLAAAVGATAGTAAATGEAAPAPSGASGSSGSDVRLVPSGTDVDYQLGGAARVPRNVGIVERDRTDPPARDVYNVCYVNGYQTQPNEKQFWRDPAHRDLLLRDADGRLVVDENWGEWLLDTSTPAKRQALAAIMRTWTQGCADDGYDAVEYDNLDSFSRSHHLLDRGDNLAYAALLADEAHDAGLAAGQKNLAGWDGTSAGYDFVVAEQCGRYRECDAYADDFGDQVLSIEYGATGFRRACAAYGDEWPIVRRDLDLTPGGIHRYC